MYLLVTKQYSRATVVLLEILSEYSKLFFFVLNQNFDNFQVSVICLYVDIYYVYLDIHMSIYLFNYPSACK